MNFGKAFVQGTGAILTIKIFYDYTIVNQKKLLCSEIADNKEKLVSLFLITRHGSRTPLFIINGIDQVSKKKHLYQMSHKYIFEIRPNMKPIYLSLM